MMSETQLRLLLQMPDGIMMTDLMASEVKLLHELCEQGKLQIRLTQSPYVLAPDIIAAAEKVVLELEEGLGK